VDLLQGAGENYLPRVLKYTIFPFNLVGETRQLQKENIILRSVKIAFGGKAITKF
jgi:hypothetical protein